MQYAPSAATLVQAVRAHGSEVTCLEARGGRLATGGGDRALRLWHWTAAEGWQPAGEARAAHRYGVVALRWAAGGALLASGGVDGAVRVWSARPLAARRQLAAPAAAPVRALCWVGGRLLAGHDDGALCVWAAAAGALLARLAPHEGALHALAAPAGRLLLTACTHGVLKVFDLAEVCACGVEGEGGNAPAPLQWVDGVHDLGALCAAAGEEGATATGGHDARIRVWRPAPEGPALCEDPALEGHAAAVTALCWAGELLASASLDRTARVWAPRAVTCLLTVAAHPRYLTCVMLAPDLRYLLTGSNDKTFRTWSLGEFTLEDELEPACAPLEHFGLGDLEGIGPVEDELDSEVTARAATAGSGEEEEGEDEMGQGSGATRVWSAQVHAGAINCIATWGELLATASSDGSVRVWRWLEDESRLEAAHTLREEGYPVLAVDFGAAGAVLLAAGLDGAAVLYDVQSGVAVRSLVVPGGAGGSGGGGVRGARLSTQAAPLALLATDDGSAPLWRLAHPDPDPLHVYAAAEAVTCCAWSADGRVAATGAAGGQLCVLAPPRAAYLHLEPHAHDLGVLSCDFAPPCAVPALAEHCYLLATAGCDSLVKLWRVEVPEEGAARVELLRQVAAHGGAVACVRWGADGALASAGADRWARVWRVALDAGGARMEQVAAAPVRGAGGAPAVALAARGSLLAVGSLAGELALWRLPTAARAPLADDSTDPRLWTEAAVARWLTDYVVEAPGSDVAPAAAAALEARARAQHITGARLLAEPLENLLDSLGFEVPAGAPCPARERARRELRYLRAAPPRPHLEALAPHRLLCPLTHRVLVWPVRAADGFTYERANLAEWVAAAAPGDPPVSPLSGRPLRSSRFSPNYRLMDELRLFLADHAPPPDAADPPPDADDELT